MSTREQLSLQRLAFLLAGGGVRCRRLIAEVEECGSLFDRLKAEPKLAPLVDSAAQLLDSEVPSIIEHSARAAWRWVVPGDDEFPSLLRTISDPPLGLFVRGVLDDRPAIAVVGSRKATRYGREVAALFAADMARMGVVVVSGMARGIDGIAHRAMIEEGGQTIAVWGTGPDRVYPSEHRELAEKIAQNGALITEYPPGTPPRKYHFPERNRLIAGLSKAVVVVEAAARSGALVTARQALDEGREVLAVPGSILSEYSVGPNALIRMGARPLLTRRDIAETLNIPLVSEDVQAGVVKNELINPGEVMDVNQIAERAKQDIRTVMNRLLELEISGEVEQLPDGRYQLK